MHMTIIINCLLWVVQTMLSLLFAVTGITKLKVSKQRLREKIGDWVDDFTPQQIKMIGLVEALAALGLVAPMLFGILPVLTPFAALGVVLLMSGAIIVNLAHRKKSAVRTNVLLMFLALFVFVGRLYVMPVL